MDSSLLFLTAFLLVVCSRSHSPMDSPMHLRIKTNSLSIYGKGSEIIEGPAADIDILKSSIVLLNY